MACIRTSLMQQVLRHINAAPLRVLFHIAEDIRQLKCNSRLFGELLCALVGIAKDMNADQADHGSNQITVAIEILKGSEGLNLASFRPGIEIHRGSLHQLLKQFVRDSESLLGIAQS